jgi:hypothetical protein
LFSAGRNSQSMRNEAEAFTEKVRGTLIELSHLSTHAIAAELTRRNIRTALGGAWTGMAVLRMQRRLGLPE